jgi:hypothetical protein
MLAIRSMRDTAHSIPALGSSEMLASASAQSSYKLLSGVNLCDSRSLNPMMIQHGIKASARVALVLTSSVEPFLENFHRLIKELFHTPIIPYHTIVVIVPSQLLIQGAYQPP